MKRLRYIFILLLCLSSMTMAQEMGTWKTFFAYNNVVKVVQTDDKIYALNENGSLFSVDTEYESIQTYSKVDGLSDGKITQICYNEQYKAIVLIYDNSNIDIIKDDQVYNVPDLKRKDISGKEVNNITTDGKYAYLSCSFGIVVLNLQKNEIADTYIIGEKGTYTNVYNTIIQKDNIYANTENGLMKASMGKRNLADFNEWNIVNIQNITIEDIATLNNHLLIFNKDSISILNEEDLSLSAIHTCDKYRKANVSGNHLLVADSIFVYNYDENLKQIDRLFADYVRYAHYNASTRTYWLAQASSFYNYVYDIYNLSKYTNGAFINRFEPNGPNTSSVAFLKYTEGKLITGSFARFDVPTLDNPGVVQIYENNKWTIINEASFPKGVKSDDLPFVDVTDVVIDPSDTRRMYISSWRSLFEVYDYVPVKHYICQSFTKGVGERNTTLENLGDRILIDGLCFDDDNNLWMTNMLSTRAVAVLKKDHTWQSLSYPSINNKETMKETFISSNGFKWIVCPRLGSGVGLMVINPKDTPFDTSDDQTKYFSTFPDRDGNTISPNAVRCIAESKDHIIWVGTSAGPILISSPENVFENNYKVERIKITREDNANYADYLLGSDQINAIIVDGGNRKWLASATSGLYLLSADGQETIKHFTTDNSPLTTNAIIDLAMNHETGELFIATSTGIFSYMTDATTPKDDYSNVYVYPNPVRPEFDGDITVNGLAENSLVRIADTDGRVVYEGYSNGGTLTWNGRNKANNRVATGIYFIFAAQEDGSMKMVTKIAFIR